MAKKNAGKQFEDDFKASVPFNVMCYRFKDATGSWGSTDQCPKCKTSIPSKTRFQAKNICDFHLYTYPNLYYIELKSVQGKSLPFGNVKDNQVSELTKARNHAGIMAGFLVNFRSVDETYYIDIKLYNKCVDSLTSKSIPLAFFRENCIRVSQEQKKVHWRYDIVNMLKDIANE